MFSSLVYKTGKETRYVLCGLPKLSIYSSMIERKRRGLRNIKSNPKSIRHADRVCSVSASCAIVRTGWGVYKLLFRCPGSLLLSTSKHPPFCQKCDLRSLWRGRRSDQKGHHAHRMLRRCAVDHNSGKKEEEEHGACFSKSKQKHYPWLGASGTCEDRSY